MRNLRLLLEYDGTLFCGWQFQPGLRTVEGVLRLAAQSLLGEEITPYAAGRTDTGVHATGQVVNFYTHTALPLGRVLQGLNAHLPDDVAVHRVDEVPEAFHARYWAIERRYRYTIVHRATRPVRERRYALHRYGRLDTGAMAEAARLLVGTHDFSAFRSLHCDAENPVRTVNALQVTRDGDFVRIDIAAKSFLRHMVRIIVGTLIDVGMGSLDPAGLAAVLASGDRSLAGRTAPARGLCLVGVEYGKGPVEDT